MAQKESILAQRAANRIQRAAQLKHLRETNSVAYAEEMAAAVPGVIGAAKAHRKSLQSSKAKEQEQTESSSKKPTRLMQEMAAISAKLNKSNVNDMEEKRKEKEVAAREAREKDLRIKTEVKNQQQNNSNFTMLSKVFKDQTDKLLDAFKKLADTNKKAGAAGGSAGGGGDSLLDILNDWNEERKKKKEGNKKGGAGSGDEFDIEGHDDRRGKDGKPKTKEQEREEKRKRRIDRLKKAKGKGGRLSDAWNRSRGFGKTVLEEGGDLFKNSRDIKSQGDEISDAMKEKGGKFGKYAKHVKVLGSVGSVLAAGDAIYNAVPQLGKLFDDESSGADKAKAGTHLALQGAGAGLGALTLGRIPGIGTMQGAAWGASAGDKIADGAEWVGEKLRATQLGDAIGAGAAIAMAPFSQEARDALTSDFENNIVPSINKSFITLGDKFESFKEGFSKSAEELGNKFENAKDASKAAIVNVFNGVKEGGKAVAEGVGNAVTQVKQGYEKSGITGAMKAVDGTATLVGQGIKKGASKVAEGVSNAGAAIKYNADKGTTNTLDLAMGFSASKGFKGMSDSESKAYAANVMKTESGGKLGITNQYGFAGQYQFGADALADNGLINTEKLKSAKKAAGDQWYKGGLHKKFMEDNSNWTNEGGRDAFLKDKRLQDDTFVKYTNRNIEAGFKSGALSANSSPADIAAYAKAAHLKGTGGANNYFLKGIDSADANGTKVSAYAQGAAQSMTALAAKVDEAKAKGYVAPADTQLAKTDAEKKYDKMKADAQAKQAKAESVGAVDGKTVTLVNGKPVESEEGKLASFIESERKLLADKRDKETKVAGFVSSSVPSETSSSTLSSKMADVQKSVAPIGMTSAADLRRIDNAHQADIDYSVRLAQTDTSRVASASAQPIPMLNSNVPPETKTVQVANMPQPAKPTTVIAGGGGGGQSSAPTLAEMPMYINDMGLVLLNIGHV